jgi:GDPmannose 4,6-dehydratase
VFLGRTREWEGVSGWDRDNAVAKLAMIGVPTIAPWLREQLYTKTGHKQVPPIVLNASAAAQAAFLRGHYAGDGLKRGNGASIKTNSPVLAQGLCWLYDLAGQPASVYVEHRDQRAYYQLNLASAARVGAKGQHLRRNPAEVRRIGAANPPDDEWVYDIETESGVFCAGVGRLVVHNSPRRGLEFVTRKVTWHAAAIKLGLADKLTLGNLDAERDWGYAKDYVEAMWLMLQRDEPADYVIATGIAHSVRDCVEVAFDQAGLSIENHVVTDPSLVRPAEVDHLIGDCTKAREQLGWQPTTDFETLIRLMVDSDLAQLSS